MPRQEPGSSSSSLATTPFPHTPLPLPQAKAGEPVRVAVLGASGYTGEEVVRLLSLHPTFKVTTLTGDRQAGKVRCWRIWG